jgi:hypothetical protein
MHRLLLVTLSTIVAACASVQSPDAALASGLVGKWSWSRVTGCCTRYEQSIEFKADGSFHGDGVRRDAAGSRPYVFGGQWKVEQNHLKFDVTSPPLDFPKAQYSERIVSMTEVQLVTIQPSSGEEYRAWKYPK